MEEEKIIKQVEFTWRHTTSRYEGRSFFTGLRGGKKLHMEMEEGKNFFEIVGCLHLQQIVDCYNKDYGTYGDENTFVYLIDNEPKYQAKNPTLTIEIDTQRGYKTTKFDLFFFRDGLEKLASFENCDHFQEVVNQMDKPILLKHKQGKAFVLVDLEMNGDGLSKFREIEFYLYRKISLFKNKLLEEGGEEVMRDRICNNLVSEFCTPLFHNVRPKRKQRNVNVNVLEGSCQKKRCKSPILTDTFFSLMQDQTPIVIEKPVFYNGPESYTLEEKQQRCDDEKQMIQSTIQENPILSENSISTPQVEEQLQNESKIVISEEAQPTVNENSIFIVDHHDQDDIIEN